MTTARSAQIMPMGLPERVARNVKAEASRQGTQQREIADVLGIAQQAVSARLNGRTPLTLRDLDVLAQLWRMDVSDLIAGRPGPDPERVVNFGWRSRQGQQVRAPRILPAVLRIAA